MPSMARFEQREFSQIYISISEDVYHKTPGSRRGVDLRALEPPNSDLLGRWSSRNGRHDQDGRFFVQDNVLVWSGNCYRHQAKTKRTDRGRSSAEI